MKDLLLVGCGGFFGAIGRFLIGGALPGIASGARFPFGTLAVNVLGCLAGGVLAGLIEKHQMFSLETRLFLFAGLLGGFTTFSTFGLESVALWRRGEAATVALYVVLSVIGGLAAVGLGLKLVSLTR